MLPGLKELIQIYLEEKLEFDDIKVEYDGYSGYILVNNQLLGKLFENQFVLADGGIPIFVPAASPLFFQAIDIGVERMQKAPGLFMPFGIGRY